MRLGTNRKLSIRAKALQKLTQYYVEKDSKEDVSNNNCPESLKVLIQSLPISYSTDPAKLYTIPLTLSEWEILLAISSAIPKRVETAKYILSTVIKNYFLDSPIQRISDVLYARFKLNSWKNPNEVLTFHLTRYLVQICNKFPELVPECSQMIEKYISKVKKFILLKQTAIFSLLGFMSCFIDNYSSIELISFVWDKIYNQFFDNNYINQVDKLLITPNSFTNEAIVQYFDSGKEISGPLFWNLLMKIQQNYLQHVLDMSFDDKKQNLGEFILSQQYEIYKHQDQKIVKSVSKGKCDSETFSLDSKTTKFLQSLNENKDTLISMCHRVLDLWSMVEKNLDFSTADRVKNSFDILAGYLNILCLSPLLSDHNFKLEIDFVRIVENSMDQYLLSDIITDNLIKAIINAGSLLNYYTEDLSEKLLCNFPLVIGSQYITQQLVIDISKIFSIGLQPLNEDAIVTTIYAINNLLTLSEDLSPQFLRDRQQTLTSISSIPKVDGNSLLHSSTSLRKVTSTSSLSKMKLSKKANSTATVHTNLFNNCVTTTITIASEYNNQAITALTISILTQKVTVVSKELAGIIFSALAKLAPYVQKAEFSAILRFFRITINMAYKSNDTELIDAVFKARVILSKRLLEMKYSTEIYKLYLLDLLDSIISSGEVENSEHHRSHSEISYVANQIALQLVPLASMLPKCGETPLNISHDEILTNKFRNMWFNMVVHGYYYDSDIVKQNYKHLKVIAYNSPPLASEFPINNKEMSLDMNTILRRKSSTSNLKKQKQVVLEYLNVNAVQSRSISDSKVMFIAATVLIESIRCETGVCSKIVYYLSDPCLVSSSLGKSIALISKTIIFKYAKLAQALITPEFNSKAIAEQLTEMFLYLIHRNHKLQEMAFTCCNLLIQNIPSALCHHDSLYTLLDLMTTVFDSILDCERNRFQPHFEFTLKHSATKVLFPASKNWRVATLKKLHNASKEWVKLILNKANQDSKILLQSYVSNIQQFVRLNNVEFGVSFALDMAGTILDVDRELSTIEYSGPKKPNTISGFISQHSWRSRYLANSSTTLSKEDFDKKLKMVIQNINETLEKGDVVSDQMVSEFLDMAAANLVLDSYDISSLVHDVVFIPFEVFTSTTMKIATNVWLAIIKERPDLAHVLLANVCYFWMLGVDSQKGLFSRSYDLQTEEYQMMEYAPYNKRAIDRDAKLASKALQPHRHIIKFFTSHFESTILQSKFLLQMFTSLIIHGLEHVTMGSSHPFARLIRFELLQLSLSVLEQNIKQKNKDVEKLCCLIVNSALSWFLVPPSWPFGSNDMKIKADLAVLQNFYRRLVNNSSIFKQYCDEDILLLQYFLASEIQQIQTWLLPLEKIKGANSNHLTDSIILCAFKKDPQLAWNLVQRYKGNKGSEYLSSLVKKCQLKCVRVPQLASVFAKQVRTIKSDAHYIIYWSPTSPLKSVGLFFSEYSSNSYILQYSVYSLESHDVNVTFFYVPQIVQMLRYDRTGYVEKLIIDTAKISVLFAHQIIWNLLANCYKDDEGTIEDPIKPTLDQVRERMIKSFSNSHLEFYNREFEFFNEVTSISGKLKPYIKKSKAEKKQKIDEEMSKIKVLPDVYLPSNPDGVVVDINRTSGKPLQSHAKAPFMATFKIKKNVKDADTGEVLSVEKWQAAIFKVGDDCRQDVLALQLISIFKTIWSNIGLDVYVFPYRVTATAPGCGVIDVLPNSISRDMLGREAVNGLYEYFITKFGPEDSIDFQNARNNFVKSLAGYSIISYLLQFKDRHNGNIMYDDQGHCLHIDFGFIFDIVPGGVKFEAVPFKLTKEMVKVMGGSSETSAFQEFEELCIKGYLAARSHMNFIIDGIVPMLDSGLPCFKGDKTIRNIRSRFQPEKTDHEAALFMKALIKKSFESIFTVGYDEFQRITNGIPY
ncbi:hypothetical protein RI543_002259 [Arxiozyma heterogenica]|uniref:1-phosphatidylinositol 4-kinase n=1 Tax=Arxiozyma heterogenica TaxID=278026 RepID=A0AAN7W3N9_9SACH|nr:hypothetical protein RI543_002259 [Kazachstania heterogenica]